MCVNPIMSPGVNEPWCWWALALMCVTLRDGITAPALKGSLQNWPKVDSQRETLIEMLGVMRGFRENLLVNPHRAWTLTHTEHERMNLLVNPHRAWTHESTSKPTQSMNVHTSGIRNSLNTRPQQKSGPQLNSSWMFSLPLVVNVVV